MTGPWKFLGLAAAIGLTSLTAPAYGLDEITYGTNWLAEAEHGGFYQSIIAVSYTHLTLPTKRIV